MMNSAETAKIPKRIKKSESETEAMKTRRKAGGEISGVKVAQI